MANQSHASLYEGLSIRQVDSCFSLAALTYLILRPLIQLLLARHSTRACPRAFSSSWEVLIWGPRHVVQVKSFKLTGCT